MVGFGTREKNLEATFVIIFSLLVFVLFFTLVGSNGLVLGNDPAVQLQTAKYFLSTHHLPSSDILWLPPLYHLVLATLITFTGAVTISQQLFIMKAMTALMDWMLVFSVYLIAAKFFSKKTGIIAASMLLLCFPLYEINSWGGYTSILGMTFMALLFIYLALPLKSVANAFVAFTLAFSIVLTHQLATFVLAFILPPFVLVVLIKSKGSTPRALIAAVVGAAIAFGIYYVRPIWPFIGSLVSIVFFQLKSMLYQVPGVTSKAYLAYFGFVVFLAFAGLGVAFFDLRKRKSLMVYLLLALAFLVPFFFSQSYLVGFLLPFQWFVYYLMPALAVLAAVTLSFLIDFVLAAYNNGHSNWKRSFLRIASVCIIAALVGVAALQIQNVGGRLGSLATYYSSSDPSAYQTATWLTQNNPEPTATAVVSQNPGHWFWVYTNMNVTTETDPIVQWTSNAECVLDFTYELEHPLTMVRVYEAKTGVSDENWVQANNVWKRATLFPLDNAIVSYRDENSTLYSVELSSLNRTISMDMVHYPRSIAVTYLALAFKLEEDILMANDTYPVTVTWHISATNSDLSFVSLYLSEYFDPSYAFTQAYVPDGILNWTNPFSNPSKEVASQWAVTNFYGDNLTSDNQVAAYDPRDQTAFALKFLDPPHDGNVGSLADGNLDAIRWEYNFYTLNVSYPVSISYQMLTLSLTSYPALKNPYDLNSLFTLKTKDAFDVLSRNFASIIQQDRIVYLIYDVNRLDKKILNSGWVEQVYANQEYVILRIKSNHPYTYILENSTDD
ncbi:MAG TPA: hypothetical protein VMD05_06825 [Candidatus Nanoarchaeia archaeon]|nr:hypothetical protein [Candidatus Nanoarchaeia archaeon]